MGRPVITVNYFIFDSGYRGPCNYEDDDAASFYLWVKQHYPDVNIFHVTNEFKCTKKQGEVLNRKGRKKGVSDYIILTPGKKYPFAVIEAKRRDRTLSQWRDGQREFLNHADKDGGFAAVGYGLDEMKKAFICYLHA